MTARFWPLLRPGDIHLSLIRRHQETSPQQRLREANGRVVERMHSDLNPSSTTYCPPDRRSHTSPSRLPLPEISGATEHTTLKGSRRCGVTEPGNVTGLGG